MRLREKIKELLVWEGPGQRVRYLHFLRNRRDLKIPQKATILDAGAGRGVYSIKLAKKVKELIMFTKWSDGGYLHIGTLYDLQKNFQYDSNDFFLFRDMDWSGFGLPWDKFQENGDNLRLEVPYLSDLEYTKRYLGFLNSLIEMHRPIYCSDIFNTKFESQANKNILKKIKILENFLKIS